MKLKSILVSGVLTLAATVLAQAQTLLNGADTDDILNATRGYGSAKLTIQSNGDPQITSKIEDVIYQIYFRNCTNNTDCDDLNFYLSFLDLKLMLEVINDWKYNKRFSRAHLDQNDDACIEMDIDLEEGATAESLMLSLASRPWSSASLVSMLAITEPSCYHSKKRSLPDLFFTSCRYAAFPSPS
ncbi:MAG: YbjN domain-containing protein [Candidatus Devosia symbiotica]|nr:YbjN domain-containing protein [Candidatus Devosia symbiotica]